MPYIAYSKIDKVTRKNKWKLLSTRCSRCGIDFTTHNPGKEYCSIQCRRLIANKKRRAKKEADNIRKAKIVEETLKQLGESDAQD